MFKQNDVIKHSRHGLCVLLHDESFGLSIYWTVLQLSTGKKIESRHRGNFSLVGRNFKTHQPA